MSLCFYYQQIYNIMKYNLFDNFYEVIEVIYNLPDNLKNGLIARLLIKRTISPFCSSLGAVFSTYRDCLSIFGHNYAK